MLRSVFAFAASLSLGLVACAPSRVETVEPAQASIESTETAAVGDLAEGRRIYKLQCELCHDDEFMAPPLDGIYGRNIASGDFGYTDALKAKKDETWNDGTLDAFLKNSHEFAPGTEIDIEIANKDSRAALIAYLKSLD
ncbi:MAG: cytochrome c family protein [Amphiplicatus sp.]